MGDDRVSVWRSCLPSFLQRCANDTLQRKPGVIVWLRNLFRATVFRPWEPKAFDVHRHFAKRSLRRRVIALVAAYALALGGLFASWAAGSAAALAAAGPAAVICHSDGSETAPSQNNDGGHVCVDSCCVGCVLLTAALPPPPVKAIGVPQSAARPLAATPALAVPTGSSTRSHQSRAPPLRA